MSDEERKTPGEFWLLDWLGSKVERWSNIISWALMALAGGIMLVMFVPVYLRCRSHPQCTMAGKYLRSYCFCSAAAI
jgi:hypothetical protein